MTGGKWVPLEGVEGGRMWLAEGLDAAAWGAVLAGLRGGGGETLQAGRHLTERVRLEVGGASVDAVLKTYGRQSGWRDWAAGKWGTKAARSMAVALRLKERGVGTPEPLAAVEVWKGGRLERCQFLTGMVEGLSDFRAELTAALSRKPARCEEIIDLLQTVADGVRGLHEVGVAHGDLGNQNIGLQRVEAEDAGWHKGWRVVFLDLNRARVTDGLTDEERGRDLARLDIPSDLRRVFFAMVHGGVPPPEAFSRAESKERAAFARHTATRAWRHPLREAKIRAAERENPPPRAPEGRELWIWDGKSGQPIQAYTSKDRRKWLAAANVGAAMRAFAAAGRAVEREARRLEGESFTSEVEMGGGFGVSVEAEEERWEEQLRWLGRLDSAAGEKVPVLVRSYHHWEEGRRERGWRLAAELAGGGRPVGIALVQDRAAVREPERWAEFVAAAVAATRGFAEFYEAGHALNRSKWGVWDYREAEGLWRGAMAAARGAPETRWTGPACIDFEPYAALPMLRAMPEGWWRPSFQLYVDRRGGPEGKQRGRDLVGKCAWLRAAARVAGAGKFADDRIMATEVNWPLAGTGEWSPVTSPYEVKEARRNDPSVGEEACAAHLARYALLALASGHVARVHWWQLAAHGYGLVDVPPGGGAWRERASFRAAEELLGWMDGARFTGREARGREVQLHFVRGRERFRAVWPKEKPEAAVRYERE